MPADSDTLAPSAPPPSSAGRRVVLLGTRGVPARYGGFETAMEEVGRRLVEAGHDVTVYCRTGNSGEADPAEYAGMRLVHLPALRHRALETPTHTLLSAAHILLTRRRFDAAVLCNAANAFALPLLRLSRIPVAVHVDGLEWRRTKWGMVGRQFYRISEALSVRWADALIADAYGIEQYYKDEFGALTEGIAYGAPDLSAVGEDKLASLGLEKDGFHLIVARFEPENHVDLMVEGYLRSRASRPLVVVGSTPYPGEHSAKIEKLAASSDKVRLLGGVWDQDLLDQLYKGAFTYLHGHSVGGTNPSLLRALGAGTFTIAFNVVFNREVAGPHGVYCSSPGEVAEAIDDAEADPVQTSAHGRALLARVLTRYTWNQVADAHGALCERLAQGESRRGLYTGRRSKQSPWRHGHSPNIPISQTADALRTAHQAPGSRRIEAVEPMPEARVTSRA